MKALPFTIPKARNASFLVQEEKLATFYPHLHRHTEVQICLIKKGHGTLFVHADFHYFKQGDIFVISSNSPHLFKNENTDGVEMLSVFFNPSQKENPLMQLTEMQNIGETFENMGSFHKIEASISDDLSNMVALDGFGQLEKFLSILRKIRPLINARTYDRPVYSEGSNVKVKQVMEYTIQHFQEHIDLEKISGHIHYSPEAFCRFFRKRTGKTYITYLNEYRINEACKKLLQEDKPEVSMIAYACGFNNVSNFNRVFKLKCNCSPLQYRRQYFSKFGRTNIND